jgi:hypothetical protein
VLLFILRFIPRQDAYNLTHSTQEEVGNQNRSYRYPPYGLSLFLFCIQVDQLTINSAARSVGVTVTELPCGTRTHSPSSTSTATSSSSSLLSTASTFLM